LIDPIRDRLRGNAPVELLALALAGWMRRMRGEDESGRPIPLIHPLASVLRARAVEGGADPRPLLAISSLFGELRDDQPFVETLQKWLTLLYGVGSQETLSRARRILNF